MFPEQSLSPSHRNLAIVFPLQHKSHLCKKRVNVVILIIWAYHTPLFVVDSCTVSDFKCHGLHVSSCISLYFIICAGAGVYTKVYLIAMEHFARNHSFVHFASKLKQTDNTDVNVNASTKMKSNFGCGSHADVKGSLATTNTCVTSGNT